MEKIIWMVQFYCIEMCTYSSFTLDQKKRIFLCCLKFWFCCVLRLQNNKVTFLHILKLEVRIKLATPNTVTKISGDLGMHVTSSMASGRKPRAVLWEISWHHRLLNSLQMANCILKFRTTVWIALHFCFKYIRCFSKFAKVLFKPSSSKQCVSKRKWGMGSPLREYVLLMRFFF